MKNLAFALCLALLIPTSACRRRHAIAPVAPAWLDAAVGEQAQRQAPDALQVGELYRGAADREGGRTQWRFTLDAGNCYWFSGVGDETVEELYLNLWNPEDDRVAKDRNDSPRIMLAYCPEMSGMFKLEAKTSEGYGHYAVGVYAKKAPKRAPKPPAPVAPKAADLEKVIADMAKSSAPGATRLGEHFAGSEDRTDWYVALDHRKCYWFIGAGDEEVSELYLYLWDPRDKRITVNKSENNRVSVGHCPTASGMFHFQAKVNSGSGKYKVGVFAKQK